MKPGTTKSGATLGDLLGFDLPRSGEAKKPLVDLFDVFTRWQLSRDDPNATEAVRELQGWWQGWSVPRRIQLLQTVEQIAQLRQVNAAWRRKDPERTRRYEVLAEEGLHAARLAESIIDRCPPPWNEDQGAIRDLVIQLVSFVNTSLNETSKADPDVATYVATVLIDEARSYPDRPSMEFLAKLAWLAGGMKENDPYASSTIGRLTLTSLETRKPTRTAAAKLWIQSWEVVRGLVMPLDLTAQSQFTPNMRQFLEKTRDGTPSS